MVFYDIVMFVAIRGNNISHVINLRVSTRPCATAPTTDPTKGSPDSTPSQPPPAGPPCQPPPISTASSLPVPPPVPPFFLPTPIDTFNCRHSRAHTRHLLPRRPLLLHHRLQQCDSQIHCCFGRRAAAPRYGGRQHWDCGVEYPHHHVFRRLHCVLLLRRKQHFR